MKTLISSAYQYYRAQEDIAELLSSVNPFYECFLNQVMATDTDKQRFSRLLSDNRFKQAYERLTRGCFNLKYPSANERAGQRMLIDTQVRKFCQYGMNTKYFLLALSMAINLRGTSDER